MLEEYKMQGQKLHLVLDMHGVLVILCTIAASVKSQMNDFDNDCLRSHNQYRGRHGTPPLVWSQALAAAAQEWANSLANRNVFEHDLIYLNRAKQGENLAFTLFNTTKCINAGQLDCIKCSEIVKHWYSQIKDYDFINGRSREGPISIFTQIVWKSTREIGVGAANSQKYGLIVVARYFPRGNIGFFDSYIQNVPLPIDNSITPNNPPCNFPPSIPAPATVDLKPRIA
ncbi:Golgi-associated plant pathogenesis-related protein 1 [Exaiptasia diaphana]|uniref:SCP domain-containing protein n=1 Tax=Exaiptasia diaphana TaxID=2652724 RepID=A0A913YH56_EXADI|nr:Golgi-associated plant pathogenesis-related protein 1 [Exaiptasia diaphana]